MQIGGARRRAALAFIFVTALIDILSFGLIIPVLPHLVKSFVGGDLPEAVAWSRWFSFWFMFMQFIFTPVQGTLSDRFGRRPVILISSFGLAVDFLFMAMANTLPLLFIGRIVSGITAASFSTANAYVADVTPPEKRAAAFGMLGMAFGLGFTFAPFIGGTLGAISPRLPFWIAFGLCSINFLYGLFVLPESLPPEKRSARFDFSHANPFGSLALVGRYPQVLGLIGVMTLIAFAHVVYPTTFVLYADFRFHWGPDMVGITLGLVGVLTIIVQGFLIKRIVAALGERTALAFGLGAGTIGFALYALAPTGYWFWAAMPIAAFWGVAQPAAQAMMTHQVDPREQGRLQGSITSLASIAGIVGSLTFPTILDWVSAAHSQGPLAGATFWAASLTLAAALALAIYTAAHLPANVRAAPAAQSIAPSAVVASTADLQPPVGESQTRV